MHLPIQDALHQVGADEDYRRLCLQQKSFRARLTPKPWRCWAPRPPFRFPFANAWQAQHFANWHRDYQHGAEGFAVCLYLLTIGQAPTLPPVATVLTEHDRVTRAESNLPLA